MLKKTKCKNKTRIFYLMTSYKSINCISRLLSSLKALSQLRFKTLSKMKQLQTNNPRQFNIKKKSQTNNLRQLLKLSWVIRKMQNLKIFILIQMKIYSYMNLTNCRWKSNKLQNNLIKSIGAVRCQTKKVNMYKMKMFMCVNFIPHFSNRMYKMSIFKKKISLKTHKNRFRIIFRT